MGAVDTGTFIRLVASLGAMLVLLWVVKRYARRGGGPARGAVRVEARLPVGRAVSVMVVGVGDKRWLIGVGEHGVSLLDRLDPADLAAEETEPSVTEVGRAVIGPPPPDAGSLAFVDVNGMGTGPRTGLLDRVRRMTLRAPGRVRSGGSVA